MKDAIIGDGDKAIRVAPGGPVFFGPSAINIRSR